MYVYCITNKINNKKYVGKMSKSVKDSKSYMGSGKLIKKAIKKYGRENFVKEILEENVAKEELSLREMFWIQKLNTKLPNGYNLTDGGDGSIGLKRSQAQIEKHRKAMIGKKASEETKKKMSISAKGKKISSEQIDKLKKALTGRKLSDDHKRKLSEAKRGRTLSESQKLLISKKHTGKITPEETKIKMSLANKHKVEVQQLSLDGQVISTYESITDAIRKTGATRSSLFRCLIGERKTHKGYIWKKVK